MAKIKKLGQAFVKWQEKTGDTLNVKHIYPSYFN